jgi:predicted Zn-dependent peptidase
MQYPERMSFSMVSSIPAQDQAQQLNQAIQAQNWFASPYRQDPPPVRLAIPQTARGSTQPVLVANPNAERAHVVMAWRAPAKNDPDYLTFLLIQKMLGSMSGGFFKVLRTERGLVYGTQQMTESHTGLHCYKVYAQVNFDKLPLAIDGLHDVVNELATKPVPEAQLNMAKSAFLFELMAASEETLQTSDRNDQFLREGIMPPHPQHAQEALSRIRPEDIQRVARKVFMPQSVNGLNGGFEGLAIAAPDHVLKEYFPGKSIQASVAI